MKGDIFNMEIIDREYSVEEMEQKLQELIEGTGG